MLEASPDASVTLCTLRHTVGCWSRWDVSVASCHPGLRVTIKPLRVGISRRTGGWQDSERWNKKNGASKIDPCSRVSVEGEFEAGVACGRVFEVTMLLFGNMSVVECVIFRGGTYPFYLQPSTMEWDGPGAAVNHLPNTRSRRTAELTFSWSMATGSKSKRRPPPNMRRGGSLNHARP